MSSILRRRRKHDINKKGKYTATFLSSDIHQTLVLAGLARGTPKGTIMRNVMIQWYAENKKFNDANMDAIADTVLISWKAELSKKTGRLTRPQFLKQLTVELNEKGVSITHINKIIEKFDAKRKQKTKS